MIRTRSWVPYAFLLPAFALICLVFAYPVVRIIDYSLRFVRGSGGPFVGLDNYRLVLDDPTFHQSVIHSALLLLAVPILTILSLLLAVILYDQVRGWRVYRSILFFPFILAIPVVAIVASYVFTLNGAINGLLRSIGLDRLALDWLGDEQVALWTVLIVIVWRELGFGIVLFLARLFGMNSAPLEAATIDGANWWQRLRYVIVPEIRGTIEFYLVIASITMLAWIFAYIFTLTKGGPGGATNVVELYIYNQGVRGALPGMASAVAVLLLGATSIFLGALFWLRGRSHSEEVA